MSYKPKSWREKYDLPGKDLPKVVTVSQKWADRFGGRRICIGTPKIIDAIIQKVPRGKLITINQIREKLAKKFHSDNACPITTGIFVRIISEVAEEDLLAGKRPSPYWRILREGGMLNPKYHSGLNLQKQRLHDEGHRVVKKGDNLVVKDFEKKLVR